MICQVLSNSQITELLLFVPGLVQAEQLPIKTYTTADGPRASANQSLKRFFDRAVAAGNDHFADAVFCRARGNTRCVTRAGRRDLFYFNAMCFQIITQATESRRTALPIATSRRIVDQNCFSG